MEDTSSEKTEFNYIVSSLFSLSNPTNVQNTSLTNGLGINTFDGFQTPVYSDVSMDQKCNSCCDKCSNPPKNSAQLLKNFRQQWYKSRDSHKYSNLPFRTNIGKKPPKIQRTNTSLEIASAIPSPSYQEVSQVANVAPADPSMLEKILNDPTGFINVQGKLREVRFYGEKSIVMMDWNDPRDVCFQSSSRRVIIDDKDIVILSFNSSYTNYTFPDGTTIRIRLGAPTRDFYIDGKPVDVKFGGPPVIVSIGNSEHKIQLGGPNPKVYIGNVKRSDIMAGRINLIIDEDLNNIIHIYLDPKPQKFDIDGSPFILRFADSLQTVFINERPFKTDFGGAPIAVKLFNHFHLLRFSALPPGIIPGLVHIANMESKHTDTAIRNLFPLILPWNDPKLTSLTAIANNNHYHINYHYHEGEAGNSQVPETHTTNSNALSKEIIEAANKQSPHLETNGIDVMNLYQKLVENGIIQPPSCEKRAKNKNSKGISVDFSKPESLKLRNMRIVYELYSGAQCDICSLRFLRKSGEFDSHLDWHYQFKRHAQEQQPLWWCHLSEFPRSEQNMDRTSWFEKQKRLDPLSKYEKLTVPAKDYGLIPKCSFCLEEFSQFYDEDTEEWLLRNAVVHNRILCHPVCCLKENKRSVALLQENINTKKISVAKNDQNQPTYNSSQGNITHENGTRSTLERSDNIVDDRISTDAKSNDLLSHKHDDAKFSTDVLDEDIEEVIVIKPELEVVDLSQDDTFNIKNSPVEELAVPSPLRSCEEARADVNEKHQDLLIADYCNSEGSLITDYTVAVDDSTGFSNSNVIELNPVTINMDLAQLSSENVSKEKGIEFKELIRLNHETVKPLIRDAVMTVQPDVVKGELISSMCSIM